MHFFLQLRDSPLKLEVRGGCVKVDLPSFVMFYTCVSQEVLGFLGAAHQSQCNPSSALALTEPAPGASSELAESLSDPAST